MRKEVIMRESEYSWLYSRLNSMEDVEALSARYPRDFLFVVYTQKTVRSVKKRFHAINRRAHRLCRSWEEGESFVSIAERLDFPPVLTAMIVLRSRGMGRKTFRRLLHHPEHAPTPRLRREISEAVAADPIYSPKGHLIQRRRGLEAERQIAEFLDSIGIEYRRERELRSMYPKTPDFLLTEPVHVRGFHVGWIESKATFGDWIEMRTNFRKQIHAYRSLFGPGMVIYWYGYIPVEVTDGVLIESRAFLKKRHIISTGE